MSIKIGLIGIGHVSKSQIEAISKIDDCYLVAAHDIDYNKISNIPEEVRFYQNLDDLLSNKDIDIVLVSTPNITHYEVALKVIKNNKPILLEKPATQNIEEFNRLIKASCKKKTFFSVALHASYAQEVIWWKENMKDAPYDLGPITGFECGFFDPYIEEGKVLEKAIGLGGSWFDSGINALSVIGVFIAPERISIEDSRMTQLSGINCIQIEGHVLFSFRTEDDKYGRGFIDTNWSLGINRKITRLFYDESNSIVVLNHSKETFELKRNGKQIIKKSFNNENGRLTNHYINLFDELKNNFKNNQNNLSYSLLIHNLLFDSAIGKIIRIEG